MYTDEDLTKAVEEGIFTQRAVDEFRERVYMLKNTHAVDEEKFRLITSFNDIFVVIACILLLGSASWIGSSSASWFGTFILAGVSWGLTEVFVLRRKMALPAIVLLITFIGGVFATCVNLFDDLSEFSFISAGVLSLVSAWLHWRRFHVPITVAAATGAVVGSVIGTVFFIYPDSKQWVAHISFVSGLLIFLFAMVWDASDRVRVTHRSDVAFWLHLLSAPLIVHPVFVNLGVLDGKESLVSLAIVIALYGLMTLISVVVDRRAFMVSSLVYVLYAFSTLLKTYGFVSDSFAVTGIGIGFTLLILSVYWHGFRSGLMQRMPQGIRNRVPVCR